MRSGWWPWLMVVIGASEGQPIFAHSSIAWASGSGSSREQPQEVAIGKASNNPSNQLLLPLPFYYWLSVHSHHFSRPSSLPLHLAGPSFPCFHLLITSQNTRGAHRPLPFIIQNPIPAQRSQPAGKPANKPQASLSQPVVSQTPDSP